MTDLSDEFIVKYGEQLFDEICEQIIGDATRSHIEITETVKHNSINFTYRGEVTLDEDRILYFSIDNGDRNGTYLYYFSEVQPEDYERGHTAYVYDLSRQSLMTSVSENRAKVANWLNLYLTITWGADLKERERCFGYDSHFAPGVVTRKHYAEDANKRKLVATSTWVSDKIKQVTVQDLTNARIDYEKAADILNRKTFGKKPLREATDAYLMWGSRFFSRLSDYFAMQGRETASGLAQEVAHAFLEKRYVLYPAPVISKTDGDEHYITANTLADLYKVPLALCHVWRHDDSYHVQDRKREEWADLIWLYPDYHGNYTIEELQPG